MLKRLKNKLPRLNLYVLLTAMLVFAAVSLCILAYLQRVYGLNQLKREINKIQASLAEVGWDMAYDNAESSTFLLSAPLTFKNFRLYALDGSKEWKAEEIKIKAGLFDNGHVIPEISRVQTLTVNGKVYPAEIPVLDINLYFDKTLGLKEISIEGMGWNIRGLATIDSLRLASQRMAPLNISELTPFFENHLEIKGAQISEDVDFPLRKRIGRIYANANIIGMMKSRPTYTESLSDWLRLGATCHHTSPRLFEYTENFLSADPNAVYARYPLFFNVWGHSFEFDRMGNWELLDRLCNEIGGREDEIWYATTIEIYDYTKAYGSLIWSADSSIVYNPTLIDIYMEYRRKNVINSS